MFFVVVVVFFPFLSLHGFLIQSKEVLCFQIPSLLSLSFAPFHKPILVVLNILPALHRNSLRRKLLSDKSVGRMFMRGGVAKFLNKTCVTEAPSKEAPRCVVAESEH